MFSIPRVINNPQQDSTLLKRAFARVAAFTLFLWLIRIIESLSGIELAQLGIFPGQISSLPGLLLAPLIHGSFAHLFANTAPLLILGTALLYGYPKSAKFVIPIIYLGTGIFVWLFARPSYHIGASGLAFGFMFFVFTIGVLRWDRRASVLSMLVFFLYGSMIWGIFPIEQGVSFESHFFGAAIGVVLAIVFRNHDPYTPEKRYDWEDEEEQDDVIELTDREYH